MAAAGGSNGFWTDEKHVSFLNRLEASFVKTMHQRRDLTYPSRHPRHYSLPLDRSLPDCAESTLDTEWHTCLQRNIQYSDSEAPKKNTNSRRYRGRRKADGKKRLPSTDDNASQDQVVPDLSRNY